jgi:3-isopropylmalate/(R)-2-methylmalate dehydratase small subunit
MDKQLSGRLIKFGNNVNTDVIIHARYLVTIDPDELAKHVFEVLGEDVPARVREHQFVVAGDNFGCGSAREQAASAIRGAGIQAVIARSFARVFFRNAINEGLPVLACPALPERVADGDELTVDLAAGTITHRDQTYAVAPLPESVRAILDAGGLLPFLKGQLAAGKLPSRTDPRVPQRI